MPISREKREAEHLADDLNGKFSHLVEDARALVDQTPAYFGAGKQ